MVGDPGGALRLQVRRQPRRPGSDLAPSYAEPHEHWHLVLPCRASLRATMAPSLPTARRAAGSPSPCRACWTRPHREASSPGPSSTFLRASRYGPHGGKGPGWCLGPGAAQALPRTTMGNNQSVWRLGTDKQRQALVSDRVTGELKTETVLPSSSMFSSCRSWV